MAEVSGIPSRLENLKLKLVSGEVDEEISQRRRDLLLTNPPPQQRAGHAP